MPLQGKYQDCILKFEIWGEDEVSIVIAEARYTGHFGRMPLGHSLSKHQGDVKRHSVHSHGKWKPSKHTAEISIEHGIADQPSHAAL
jgi:hypothetical protein